MPYKDPDIAREKSRQYAAKYYLADNGQKCAIRMKRWRERHPEKAKQNRLKQARTIKGRFNILRGNGRVRNIPFHISIEEYSSIINHPCYYCGGSLPEAGGGIDRIDNSKGYILGNVRPCCSDCNTMKMTLNEEQFKTKILLICKKLGWFL